MVNVGVIPFNYCFRELFTDILQVFTWICRVVWPLQPSVFICLSVLIIRQTPFCGPCFPQLTSHIPSATIEIFPVFSVKQNGRHVKKRRKQYSFSPSFTIFMKYTWLWWQRGVLNWSLITYQCDFYVFEMYMLSIVKIYERSWSKITRDVPFGIFNFLESLFWLFYTKAMTMIVQWKPNGLWIILFIHSNNLLEFSIQKWKQFKTCWKIDSNFHLWHSYNTPDGRGYIVIPTIPSVRPPARPREFFVFHKSSTRLIGV